MDAIHATEHIHDLPGLLARHYSLAEHHSLGLEVRHSELFNS